MSKKPSKPELEVTPEFLETRTKEKLAALIISRDQIRMQLNGVENQIYVLEQLLNPEPPEEIPPPVDRLEAQEKPPKGIPTPDGTM